MKNALFGILCMVLMAAFLLFPFETFGEEELLEMRVAKCVRPNLVVAEVLEKEEFKKVRVKLAGVSSPLEDPEAYRLALSRLRELVEGRKVYFDFALGHTPEEHPWVGYLYVQQDPEEEPCIVNAVLLCEGLVTLDERTAGRNLLGYLLSMQEKAKEAGVGLWRKIPKERKRKVDECPSCIIR
ncbi:hypothetical protein [Candidatus Caldatribacterium saccharofermentans]|uniref:TNase-like domain-containing protein n=1 Tax=Candidatus Caldatribacterium saccharofermentans TaxID=1454753 RepID=A0A7V4THM5_9BACT